MRHLLRHMAVAIAMVAALAWSTPAQAAGYQADFFTHSASQEAVLSEMTIHPAALKVGDVTYIAYQGVGFDPYVVAYDKTTGSWTGPSRAGYSPLQLDAHGAPALFVDAGGYLHVLYGSHSTPLRHAVSLQPGSTEGWRDLPSVANGATYPQPMLLADGSLMLFYRRLAGYRRWCSRITTDSGATWSQETTVLAGDATGNWYADAHVGPGGTVHLAFARYDMTRPATPEHPLRYDLYYARRDVDGVWRNADSVEVTSPIDLTTAEERCVVYRSSPGYVNEMIVKEGPLGVPQIQFLTGSGRGRDAWTWKFARRVLGQWKFADLAKTDHGFDSATFDPRPDGSVHSYLVTGGSEDLLPRLGPSEGRGGRIEHWISRDMGATWRFSAVVTPDEPGTLYADPQMVQGGDEGSRLVFTEWSNDLTAFEHRMYLYGDDGPVTRETTPAIERLAGSGRVSTSVAVSKRTFPERSSAVFIATSRTFPDALAAAPLAQAMRAPILLSPSGSLPETVSAEIRRLKPSRAVLLGGEAVLSEAIESQITSDCGVPAVERIAGANRYATAAAIAERLRGIVGPQGTVILVNGLGFADALSASPYAAWKGYPILLAKGSRIIPASTRNAIDAYAPSRTIIVGGTGVISPNAASSVPGPKRIAGSNRYETAARFARFSVREGMLDRRFILASGEGFADAMVSGVLGAHTRAPLLLTPKNWLVGATRSYLSTVQTATIDGFVLGGPAAVGEVPFRAGSTLVGAEVTP